MWLVVKMTAQKKYSQILSKMYSIHIEMMYGCKDVWIDFTVCVHYLKFKVYKMFKIYFNILR